jgi:hypothetical protein
MAVAVAAEMAAEMVAAETAAAETAERAEPRANPDDFDYAQLAINSASGDLPSREVAFCDAPRTGARDFVATLPSSR